MTVMCGTWFSTLTNGVIVIGLHGIAFIGGWIEQIAALTNSPHLATVGIISSLLMPSEALWHRASFEMQSSFARTLRSEEHTSELQSQSNLVCRLLLEKKKR